MNTWSKVYRYTLKRNIFYMLPVLNWIMKIQKKYQALCLIRARLLEFNF